MRLATCDLCCQSGFDLHGLHEFAKHRASASLPETYVCCLCDRRTPADLWDTALCASLPEETDPEAASADVETAMLASLAAHLREYDAHYGEPARPLGTEDNARRAVARLYIRLACEARLRHQRQCATIGTV